MKLKLSSSIEMESGFHEKIITHDIGKKPIGRAGLSEALIEMFGFDTQCNVNSSTDSVTIFIFQITDFNSKNTYEVVADHWIFGSKTLRKGVNILEVENVVTDYFLGNYINVP